MFRIFIPFHNVGSYLGRSLETVRNQTYDDWLAYVFDDASTDQSREIAQAVVAADSRFTLQRNASRQWLAGNLFRFSKRTEFSNSDIVVQLDGDDWFPDPRVLERVRRTYENYDVWITYGNFIRFQNGELTTIGYCKEPDDFANLRSLPWTTSALKTFYLGLLRKVGADDFLGPDGDFLRAASDVATILPMLEMAGPERSRCLSDINYVYNMDNPYRTPNVRKTEQDTLAAMIRSRPRYTRLHRSEW
jgi:glycosyltransferase involved in cell wall biosynthesis